MFHDCSPPFSGAIFDLMTNEIENPAEDISTGTRVSQRRNNRYAGRLTAFAFACCFLVFFGGFALFAVHVSRMRVPDLRASADAIVVLTGGQARIDTAVELLKEGKGKRLLISGVNPIAADEDLRAATGADETLFDCCVDIDRKSLDTIGNAEESAKWVDENAYGNIILVTNNYHMPRSLLEMHRLLRHAKLRPYPVINTPLDHGEWLTKPDALRVIFTEYTKYVAALARGLLPEMANGPDVHVAAIASSDSE